MRKIKKITAAIVILMVFLSSGIAVATPLVNSGFETGDLTGWGDFSLVGDVAVVMDTTAADGTPYVASEGDYFAMLSGTSTLWQRFSWNAGDVLSFDWAFLAGDAAPNNDIAVSVVTDTVNWHFDFIDLANVADVGDYGDTGWQTYTSDPFATNGDGYISFFVMDRGGCNTFCNASSLLVDDVNIGAAPIPEPTTMLLSSLGLLGFGGWSLNLKRRKKCK